MSSNNPHLQRLRGDYKPQYGMKTMTTESNNNATHTHFDDGIKVNNADKGYFGTMGYKEYVEGNNVYYNQKWGDAFAKWLETGQEQPYAQESRFGYMNVVNSIGAIIGYGYFDRTKTNPPTAFETWNKMNQWKLQFGEVMLNPIYMPQKIKIMGQLDRLKKDKSYYWQLRPSESGRLAEDHIVRGYSDGPGKEPDAIQIGRIVTEMEGYSQLDPKIDELIKEYQLEREYVLKADDAYYDYTDGTKWAQMILDMKKAQNPPVDPKPENVTTQDQVKQDALDETYKQMTTLAGLITVINWTFTTNFTLDGVLSQARYWWGWFKIFLVLVALAAFNTFVFPWGYPILTFLLQVLYKIIELFLSLITSTVGRLYSRNKKEE